MQLRRFEDRDLTGVLELFRIEGYSTYTDAPMRALVAFKAPGSTSFVAQRDGIVVGFVQILSDGLIQAHLSQIITHPSYRRHGVAKALIAKAFSSSGAMRMDLLSEQGAESFYESFVHKKGVGYRIYPNLEHEE